MYRIGYASDIHKLVPERKLILGGVEIPYHLGLLGHSDADVVLHAVSESILGALALGDLGTHFPDTDEKYKNYNSLLIVQSVVEMMKKEGYVVNNIDISISLEKPKLKQYIYDMRQIIARELNVDMSRVSIKAGTNEGMGEVGNNKACIATAIVMLKKGDL